MHPRRTPDMLFRGEYAFLSNMYLCDVWYAGRLFKASEIAYVYAKCALPVQSEKVALMTNPYDAKKFGKTVELYHDWDKEKLQIMCEIVFSKFSGNAGLRARLLAIKGDIVEDNMHNDRFWGVCIGVGKNHLGKILMLVRESLA